jgi:hypothetical protein
MSSLKMLPLDGDGPIIRGFDLSEKPPKTP